MINKLKSLLNFIDYIEELIDFWFANRKKKIKIAWKELRPYIFDRNRPSQVEKHYYQQDCWAIKKILENPDVPIFIHHYDVGSRVDGFVGQLSAMGVVYYVDINPPAELTPNLRFTKGSITSLPFPDGKIYSLSSLHVIEHIGLGRYGDAIDPDGWKKAIAELIRVLAPGGNLFISVPVGRERTVFNAHRVFHPYTILNQCKDLRLIKFDLINDSGVLWEGMTEHNYYIPRAWWEINYGCGLFHFRKEER